MNRLAKILIVLLLSLLVLAAGSIGIMYYAFDIDIFDRSGWSVSDSGSILYLNYYGEPLSEWQLIDGQWYYFDPLAENALTTGWLEIDGCRYYLDNEGVRQSGWQQIDGKTYYFSLSGGSAATGWLTIDEERYYFDTSAQMVTGWLELDHDRYHLADDGTLDTGWLELEENRYYLADNGAMHTGWFEDEDGKRYFDPESGALCTGWQEIDHYRRFFSEEGVLCTGWTDTPDGKFYLNDLGSPATGWQEIDGKRFYFDETSGQMMTGWQEFDGTRYYFLEDGSMAIGKVIIDDTARYFASDGAYVVMVNAWNAVPEDYKTELKSYGQWRVDASCYDALKQMLSDCPYSYDITSAYRSEATQQYIWDTRIQRYRNQGYSQAAAQAAVLQSVAVPGTSEHHLGLAIDISSGTAGHNWLAEHSWEYGFIVRYPDGYTDITGIIYEPWHFRYLGTKLAKEVYESGLCLEQYFDMLTEQQGSDAGTASNPEKYTSTYRQQ